ncbi:hypothetical protein MJ589_06730 [Escherichia coli]|nr:hypothetical protein MJ589_06730 [Escherichia coli]
MSTSTRSSVDLLRLRKQSLATSIDFIDVSLILEDGTTYSEASELTGAVDDLPVR